MIMPFLYFMPFLFFFFLFFVWFCHAAGDWPGHSRLEYELLPRPGGALVPAHATHQVLRAVRDKTLLARTVATAMEAS
jgi:hypothetical protein